MQIIPRQRWLIIGAGLIAGLPPAHAADVGAKPDASGPSGFGHATAADIVPPTDQTAASDETAAPEEGAAAEPLPLISVDTSFELEFDDTFGTSQPDAVVRSLYATIEPEITINASENFRFFAHMVFEPVLDPPSQTTSYFRDEGLYFEQLYAQGTLGPVDVSAGLIDPIFGLASDDAPGLYGSDFASSYDYLGAAGLAADWTLSSQDSGDGGTSVEQVVQVSLFNADRTALSKSLFTDRGQTLLSDGGVGNTASPESFALAYSYATLDADEQVAGPTARLAVRRLAAGQGDANDEWGLLAAAETAITIGNDRTLKPIAEFAYFVNEAGGSSNATNATLGGEIDQGPWSVSMIGALHDTQGSGTPIDYMITGSVGCDLDFAATGPFQVSAGYSYAREAGVTGNTVGVLLSKDFSWQR